VQGCKRSIFKKQKTKISSAARVETIDFQKTKNKEILGCKGGNDRFSKKQILGYGNAGELSPHTPANPALPRWAVP